MTFLDLDVEGLFRIPGSATAVQSAKMKIDRGGKEEISDTLDAEDPHVIASLLKSWFRVLQYSSSPEISTRSYHKPSYLTTSTSN